ncbi:MAG: homoserine dehydrogenase [Nitrospinota bacterium]|nr:homoserine dehydrogenase [Nitrospinota bacterium]
MKQVRIGMIGLGSVGQAVARILMEDGSTLEGRAGAPLALTKVAVSDLKKKREVSLDPSLLTTDPFEVVNSPEVDIVVEVMGGENPAFDLAMAAARKRKGFVTANKLLLALRGAEVYEAFEKSGARLGFEAAVAGAIPIIRSIREGFAGDRIELVQGIINGTGNYILSRMTGEGSRFEDVLKDAQALGYAEADPTLDVEGIDSAHKIAVLAAIAFQTVVDFEDVYTEGITRITPEDIDSARDLGYRIKLLAIAQRIGETISLRVHPAMLPERHFLANVNGPFNAVETYGKRAGVNMLVGRGAGGGPTASAVMGDVMAMARDIASGAIVSRFAPLGAPMAAMKKLAHAPMEELCSEYYLRFTVLDKPGVLAIIAGALGAHNISIASMIQRGRMENQPVSVVIMTHDAVEESMKNALERIEKQGVLVAPPMLIRIAADGKD